MLYSDEMVLTWDTFKLEGVFAEVTLQLDATDVDSTFIVNGTSTNSLIIDLSLSESLGFKFGSGITSGSNYRFLASYSSGDTNVTYLFPIAGPSFTIQGRKFYFIFFSPLV